MPSQCSNFQIVTNDINLYLFEYTFKLGSYNANEKYIFRLLFKNYVFYFQLIVGSHAVLRYNTERSCLVH